MDDEAIFDKSNLQLQLHQPNKLDSFGIDGLEHLTSDSEEDEPDEVECSDAEEQEEEKPQPSASAKIPLLYQVEPGCTALSCYASIITFIIMVIGVFALLMISPPFTAAQRKEPHLEIMIERAMERDYKGLPFPENFGQIQALKKAAEEKAEQLLDESDTGELQKSILVNKLRS